MPLTELMIKQAKPERKTYTMPDGNGLILEIRPNGGNIGSSGIGLPEKKNEPLLGFIQQSA